MQTIDKKLLDLIDQSVNEFGQVETIYMTTGRGAHHGTKLLIAVQRMNTLVTLFTIAVEFMPLMASVTVSELVQAKDPTDTISPEQKTIETLSIDFNSGEGLEALQKAIQLRLSHGAYIDTIR